MRLLANLIAGILFGLGLVISGMANPLKVQNFLDIFGAWDPSLAFVMAGAILVTMPGYFILRTKARPLFAAQFEFPTRRDLDKNLIVGSAIFGMGWGIGGFCPGPALTSLSTGATGAFIFIAAMLVGMTAAQVFKSSRAPQQKAAASATRQDQTVLLLKDGA